MDKVTFVAVLIAWILAEINCFMWKRRAKDAERELEYYRIAVSGLLNRWHKFCSYGKKLTGGSDNDMH